MRSLRVIRGATLTVAGALVINAICNLAGFPVWATLLAMLSWATYVGLEDA